MAIDSNNNTKKNIPTFSDVLSSLKDRRRDPLEILAGGASLNCEEDARDLELDLTAPTTAPAQNQTVPIKRISSTSVDCQVLFALSDRAKPMTAQSIPIV